MSDLGYKPLGFESDVNNPNFAGAQDPNSSLHVEFYWHEPFDKNKTEAQFEESGIWRPIKLERTIYVRIMKPGDKTTIIEERLREDHKRRWPQKWMYFQIQNGMVDGGADQPGWKIEEWEELTPEEIHNLKFLRFYTVEQIAAASDGQVQSMGMGGLGLRKKAKDACNARATQAVRSELDEKDKQLTAMQAQLDALSKLVKGEAEKADKPKRKYTRRAQPEATV